MNGKISNYQQIAYICQYTINGGISEGLEVLECDNGKIRFLLNISKALDIMQLFHEGQNVSFVSKNGFTKRQLSFAERFEGGMLYTCGLDSLGGREGYETHGSLHNTPAQITLAKCNEKGITVEAIIPATALFGSNLLLKRRIFTGIGAENVNIEDTLINNGFCEQNYCLLYHINVGYPLLDEGARIIANTKKVTPRTALSKEKLDDMYTVTAPVPCEEETCYFLDLEDNIVSLVNEKIGKTFTVAFSKDTLPHFLEWHSMASGDYAVGLEPCTTVLDDGFTYKTLKSGEKVRFTVNISVSK